jgi:carbon storage regulator
MLVLSRKLGERIVIGENVTITVVAVHGDRVKLGFEAPGSIAIHREEIHHRIQAEETRLHARNRLVTGNRLPPPVHAEIA